MSVQELAGSDLRQRKYRITILDEQFATREVTIRDQRITGAQIVVAAGQHPVEDYVVLQQLGTFAIESLRSDELVDISKPSVQRFFVIKGDRSFRFTVDGLPMEWPRNVITGLAIKRLIGKDADDVELVLEREATPDKVIDDEDEVRLGQRGVEIFKTRRAQVTIIVNTRPKPWTKKKISFAEVVALAYPRPPSGQNLVFTVGFFDGPPRQPEGSLTEGDSVRVRDQMVFDVKFTDKS